MKRDLKSLTILFRAQATLERLIQEDVKRNGLSATEFGVLEALYHLGPQPVQSLTGKILIAPSSMSYVLTQLKEKGWVVQTPDAMDKRVKNVALTFDGKTKMDEIYPLHEQALRERFDRLSETEEQELQRLLKTIGK
jgi:MarR family transcriptional regulator, 2-MHQ and catechol-resistance regulon repressor